MNVFAVVKAFDEGLDVGQSIVEVLVLLQVNLLFAGSHEALGICLFVHHALEFLDFPLLCYQKNHRTPKQGGGSINSRFHRANTDPANSYLRQAWAGLNPPLITSSTILALVLLSHCLGLGIYTP